MSDDEQTQLGWGKCWRCGKDIPAGEGGMAPNPARTGWSGIAREERVCAEHVDG